ncbi:MAG TPA: hypothetical protein GX515_05030 [Firmicutes bacterium]|nr:hypothetical protein [Bacillota bacterium]
MGARFLFDKARRKGLSEKDFPPEGMPEFLRSPEDNRWGVYRQYKIYTPTSEEHQKLFAQSPEKEVADLLGGKVIDYDEPECIWSSPASGISRVYNPFTDSPEVFLEFASLGRSEQPQKDRILKFVQSYGDILYADPPFYLSHAKIEWERGSSVEEFHREARIAYNALRLFEEVMALDKERVKQHIAYLIGNWDALRLRGLDECKPEQYEECLRDGEVTSTVDCPKTGCDGEPPIEKVLQEIDDPIEAGSFLLLRIILAKMHASWDYPVLPVISYQFEYRQGKSVPRFYSSWSVPTLLQAIWTLFYLKVTNQIEQDYRICPFCEEPIIKPRRNQIYHDGCRQAKFNQDKREVLRLFREGRSVEEIADETGFEIARIEKWIKGGSANGGKSREER